MTDVVELKYPTWMIVGIRLGVILFFGLAAFLFFLAFQAINQGSIFALFFIAALGGFVIHLAMAGSKLLPYLSCSIRVDKSGFQIIGKDRIESFSWSQPLVLRNNSYTQILEVFDSNENRIVAIDHKIGNFDVFHTRLTGR